MKMGMKTFAVATALTAAAFGANAASAAVFTVDIDVSGISSYGELGDPSNVLMDVLLAPDALVTGIGWDVTIEAFSPSWQSEIAVAFLNSLEGLNLSPGAGTDSAGTGSYSSGGILDLGSIDPTFPFSVGSDGLLNLEFFEQFDDSSVSPDGQWLSGTLTIQYEADDTPTPGVPEPTTWAMMIGGLGLVGAFLRRSRKAARVSFS